MPDYSQSLGTVIRTARLQEGLTQSQAASLADIDVRTVLNIENQHGNPKMEVLFPLIRALHIDPTLIFYPELEQQHTAFRTLQLTLSQCNEDECALLLPIIETILAALRTPSTSDK